MTEVAMEYLEDMFKEVVKKLYGDQELESSGPLKMMQTIEQEKEDDSQSSLPAIQMSVVQNGFSPAVKETLAEFENAWISSDESLSWTDSSIASYNMSQKLFRCNDCECVGMLSRVAEHWLGTHANLRVFQCSQCPYASAWARCVRMHLSQQHNIAVENNGENIGALFKENPVLGEVTDYLERLRSKVESLQEDHDMIEQEVEGETELEFKEADIQVEAHMVTETQFELEDETQILHTDSQLSPNDSQIETEVITTDEELELKPQETLITIQIPRSDNSALSSSTGKRYNCSYCSYGTDRRDLYTRHENIHKEEKPFHCYVCQKQFNRADHVKKHFLRMHRDHTYENSKIKRDLSRLNNQVKQQFITIQKPSPSLPEIKIPFTYPADIVPKITFVQQRPSVIEDGSSTLNSINHQNNTITLNSHQTSTGTVTLTSASTVTLGTSLSTSTATPTVINLKRPVPVKERRFTCCYCSWSGTDNWCLKRHLNTHIKPFNCTLCEYKAARPERLATHVAKVHNKRICSKCNFLADDQETMNEHLQQQHI
ncbi:hypothetical protein WDU94_015400 [Cyamophila willieti]